MEEENEKRRKENPPNFRNTPGGGILESKSKPGELGKFNKTKKQKRIVIGSIVGMLLVLGGITLYKTFALYEEKKEFNVLKGIVPFFPYKGITLANYIISKSVYDASIEEFTHSATKQTPTLTDYRYIGKNPNNFVCFGSEEETCPEENLYRIIGAIPTQSEIGGEYKNRVKLIKADYYIENESHLLTTISDNLKGYAYTSDSSNNLWQKSTLQTNVLNTIYWQELSDYQDYIDSVVWNLGSLYYYHVVYEDNYNANTLYAEERDIDVGYGGKNFNNAYSFVTNIGLMYASDYAYSIGFSDLSVKSNKDVYMKNSWLYSLKDNFNELIISPENAFVTYWGIFADGSLNIQNPFIGGIRPTFYLKSSIEYKSGKGTIKDPYRV